MGLLPYIRVWTCVPSSNVIRTMRNLRYNYGTPLWTIFGDELLECRCDVGLSVRCVDFRRSTIGVDLRGLMIDVSTFEDG